MKKVIGFVGQNLNFKKKRYLAKVLAEFCHGVVGEVADGVHDAKRLSTGVVFFNKMINRKNNENWQRIGEKMLSRATFNMFLDAVCH